MNSETPFAKSALNLRMIIGRRDVAELAKTTGIAEQRLRDAVAGRVGLETDEIQKIGSGQRAHTLNQVTALERRHPSEDPNVF